MSPRELGWRPAPAWCRPGRLWMVWPAASGNRETDQTARDDCLGLAELLAAHAPVSVICQPGDVAECSLRTPPGVSAIAADHRGLEVRSHAPLWLVDGEERLAAAVAMDSPLTRAMADVAGIPLIEPPPFLPVGGLDCDGEGTALLSVTVAETAPAGGIGIETALAQWLGIERVIWLAPVGAEGLAVGARFLAPGVVALDLPRDPRNPGFAVRAANRDTLSISVDARGRRLKVVELPCAKKRPGCYADCLLAGDQLVVPEFEDGRGQEAFDRVADALPNRRMAAFPASFVAPMGAGLGSLVVAQPVSV